MEFDPKLKSLAKRHLRWISRHFYMRSIVIFLEDCLEPVKIEIASKVIYKFILFTNILEERQFLRLNLYLDVRDASKLESARTELRFIQRLVPLNLVRFTITLC